MTKIYRDQPANDRGIWNRMEYRPLEGFDFAITPFNFTALAGNVASAPALMGNTVVWKPSDAQIFSAHVVGEAFREAGLPDGGIDLVFADRLEIGAEVYAHHEFA